ncbi:MAG TPA: tetratricopeptide repeat protein [Candidatus Gastranaerophilales bacterium]|nr:tetratricopeptide repeat protein [Candidatus Gastranaerophilales bacterium]
MIYLHTQSRLTPYYNKNNYENKETPPVLLNRNTVDTFSFSSNFIKDQISVYLKTKGDELTQNTEDEKAIFYYKESIKKQPDYVHPYYNLAKIYEKKNQPDQAVETYKNLLKIKPDEVEAQTLMGNIFKQKKEFDAAKKEYIKAVEIDPKYDLAVRSLKETENLILERENPEQAKINKDQAKKDNLKASLNLVNQHAPQSLIKALKNIEVLFADTDSLSGHRNIAQYEHHNKRIVNTNDYIWAAPQINAAYIIHEAVHAKDRDGKTSIREEQDAYQASIEFWIAHNNGVKDPELDYAAELYKENPDKLRERVASTYRSRDKNIPEYSPNHTASDKIGFTSKLNDYFSKLQNIFN